MNEDPSSIFRASGYPEVKVFEEYFEIKAIDSSEYRRFYFNQIVKFKYWDPGSSNEGVPFWGSSRGSFPMGAGLFHGSHKGALRIYKSNGGSWDYTLSNEENRKFTELVKLLRSKINS